MSMISDRSSRTACARTAPGARCGAQNPAYLRDPSVEELTDVPAVAALPDAAQAALANDTLDAVLLLSLVSGRNAQYLIEEHVRAVPFFERHPEVQAISTAYCLVDGGHVTSVESVWSMKSVWSAVCSGADMRRTAFGRSGASGAGPRVRIR